MIYPRVLFDEVKNHLDSPEALIITGMRRTGKTTLLNHLQGKVNYHHLRW